MNVSPRACLGAALLAVFSAAVVPAQNPRSPVLLDTSTDATTQLDLGASGDFTVAAYVRRNPLTGDSFVEARTSDGTALDWSPAFAFPIGSAAAVKRIAEDRSVEMGGPDRACVAWIEFTSGLSRNLHLSATTDGGQTWSTPVSFPVSILVDDAAGFAVRSVPGAIEDTVHVAVVAPRVSGQRLRPVLYTSTDSGRTFGAPVIVSQASNIELSQDLDLEVAGEIVHLSWLGFETPSSIRGVFYQRSEDGGVTWLPQDLRVDDPGTIGTRANGLDMAVDNGLVSVGFSATSPGSEARLFIDTVLTSATSFGPDLQLGQPAGSLEGPQFTRNDSDGGGVMITPSGRVVAAWIEENTFGTFQAVVAISQGSGQIFSQQVLFPTGFQLGSAEHVELVSGEDGSVHVVVSTSGPDQRLAFQSLDGGLTFNPSVTLLPQGSFAFRGNHSEIAVDHSSTYRNLVVAMPSFSFADNNSSMGSITVTGYRSATITNNGFGTSAPTANFVFEGFTDDLLIWAVVSTIPTGRIPLPTGVPGGGRYLNLTLDQFFPAPVAVLLTFNGTAATQTVPNNFPLLSGFTVSYTALGFNATGFGNIPDTFSVTFP